MKKTNTLWELIHTKPIRPSEYYIFGLTKKKKTLASFFSLQTNIIPVFSTALQR